jgi:hypothetical protein
MLVVSHFSYIGMHLHPKGELCISFYQRVSLLEGVLYLLHTHIHHSNKNTNVDIQFSPHDPFLEKPS